MAVVVVAAADSPFQNCYLDPPSLSHRVAAVVVPSPVEVDDSVHWYWLDPFAINYNSNSSFSRQERYFFPTVNTRCEFSFRITNSGPFSLETLVYCLLFLSPLCTIDYRTIMRARSCRLCNAHLFASLFNRFLVWFVF